ncbi:MAG TPA: molybdopterin-dependent oxidoreductase, partial [Candidatus Dormibacteraeota bacterium]|nr:molybdopterin-dependent oxidoreductase [Candidatus Dormibacteraeota bacterium]
YSVPYRMVFLHGNLISVARRLGAVGLSVFTAKERLRKLRSRRDIPDASLQLSQPDYGPECPLRCSLNIRNMLASFQVQEQITRLVCVEGWSAIAWWAGLRFDDLLSAYPPVSQAKWARIESSVNLGSWGNPDPYFVSLDLPTARHPQTLLATHLNGNPLTVEPRFEWLYL